MRTGCQASGSRLRICPIAVICPLVGASHRHTGASMGYVGEPLKRLGLEPGERARVTIKGPCLVELTEDDGSAEHSQGREANEILDRMMQRRKVL